ncbi:non-ribosomal peptide synthetase [Paenibacillus sp. FSL K6-1230]|uniref:non-ribosomal peptide synthetase n=1 Tax=Paenibacillus sp. FSL K6-1230 TaxID=2921603 RepID=UPI0030F70B6D
MMNMSMIISEEYPLSAYQKDIWLEQCMHPDKPIYNIGGYIEVKGPLDAGRLERAIMRLIHDNDSLRIRLTDHKGEPRLTLLPEVDYKLPFHNFSKQEDPKKYCQAWMRTEFLKPFQSDDYYFQFHLLQADTNTYFILLKGYHLIIDGWGFALLINRMMDNYNSLAQGIVDSNTATYSYTDFILDNQEYLQSATFLKDREFWKNKLATLPEPLFGKEAVRGRDSEDSIWSDRQTLAIHKTQYNQMLEFCKAEGCSSFHYFLGLLFLYFSRVCNRSELVIGVPVFNRSKVQYKQTLGHFANVLPLRISPGQDMTFKELLRFIKRELMQCYRHQKMPLGEIQRAVYEHSQNKGNLFDISLSFEEQDISNAFQDTICGNVTMTHHHERNALTLLIWGHEGEGDVAVNFDYRIQTFAGFIPMEDVIRHFRHLFAQGMEHSDRLISHINIVPEDERSVQLQDFNQTAVDYPREQTIQQRFEEQAASRADHPVLVWDGQLLTYQELNARANRLARTLRGRGVQPDDIVAIMMERSPEMVIAVLATLKAGGAYLPIDPNYPEERIQYMLEDSGASLLLTQQHLLDKAGTYAADRIIEVGAEYVQVAAPEDSINLEQVNSPNDLAYIIYTSGSTGRPKGVMVEHRGVLNLQQYFADHWGVSGADRMLQFASSSFDASVWEMFTIWLGGGTLHLISRDVINHLHEFVRYMNEQEITIALLPPTYLANLEPKSLPKLRKLVTGGSAITKELVTRWKDHVEYMNAYGPSESTVIATTWTYQAADMELSTVPIGKPIANTRVYVLDPQQQLLPLGAAGELCIAGDGLARGYLNRPELTAEKFVNHPYDAGQKLYRTGDLVRWLPGGTLEFLGRIDDQVKIRGFRIELGEIEQQLQRHPLVWEAAVVARSDQQGEKYLAAYITAEAELEPEELRQQLLEELPDYMVPSTWMQLEQMPLSSSGKIDRKVLPEPIQRTNTGTVAYVAPRTVIEQILVKVWEQVLKVERVGIRDHFLNLGGDSIKAIQIVSKLHDYKLQLQLKDLFDHPLIEELSACVQSEVRRAFQGTVNGRIVTTPIQSWFFEQPFAAKHHFNQSVLLRRAEGFDEALLRRVFDRLVAHHDVLRLVVREHEGQAVLFNRDMEGQFYSLEVKDFTALDQPIEAVKEASAELQQGMDIQQGPLVQAGLFRTTVGDYLCISIHHLVVDGVSWRILFEDMAMGYRQAEEGQPVTFQEKTDSFLMWSERLQTYADSEELKQELAYWRELDQLEIKPVPKDYPVQERTMAGIRQVEVMLDELETTRLLKEVNKAYNTEINDILLTALVEAVHEWTGEEQVLVNLEGHGREQIVSDINISRTVGWFTAQFPVVLDMAGAGELSSRIKSIKEGLRRIPHKGMGYGILKYMSKNKEQMSPISRLQPEISFNYLGQFDEDTDIGVFTIADVLTYGTVSPDMPRPYCLDINGSVREGRLCLSFAYHKDEYDNATMKRVAESFRRHLQHIIEHCATREYTELTTSDISSSDITSLEIEEVYRRFAGVKAKITDMYTLSPMQSGMLFHFLKEKDSPAYFEQAVLHLEGELDKELLEQSFRHLIQRHDILRTAFIYERVEKPIQVVLQKRPVDLFYQYISFLSEKEQENYLQSYLEKDKARGFDLTRDPLIRVALIRMSTDSYRLVWSFHHIIMDGWCLGIVFKELLEVYHSLQQGKEPQLGPAYPYGQYIRWLEQREDHETASYWERYLADYENPALLPRNQNGIVHARYQQDEYDFVIAGETKMSLESIARDNGATLSTLMQAVWGVLLQRYNNTRDVVFGSVVSGRPAEIQGVERMVGLFINTIPVRVQADQDETFSALLGKLQREALEAEQHHYSPLAEIQSRTAQGSELVHTLMAFENYPMEEVVKGRSGTDTDVRILAAQVSEQTNYDFNFIVMPGSGLQIKFRYNRLAYNRSFVERLASQVRRVIREIIQAPGIRIDAIEVVAEDERNVQLHDFNQTAADYPREQTIQERFEEQAASRSDHSALVWDGQLLTYRELNARANRLARTLRGRGVQPDDIVAIMMERSTEMVIGVLATLKAGGAYLPIDPNYPEERIQYMLEDSGASLLLTQQQLCDKAGAYAEDRIIEVGAEYVQVAAPEDSINLERVNSPNDLAYIIYTSGSTGRPKGVMVEHRGVLNLQQYFADHWGVSGADRMLQFASSSFDASVWEMFTIWLGGGTLHLISRDVINHLNEFARYMNEQEITIALLPPTYLANLEPESLPKLRKLVTGGSAITKELVTRWKDHVEYMNAYGPSESTVIATTWTYQAADMELSTVPIGKPIANTRLYVLDPQQQLLPLGAAGELCIAGDGLARGYLNRPELTAEKFVDHPYETGQKLYRTGDLVRWLPGGTLEFLGRIDDQVKIRGFRIELGEIEQQLQKHPLVREVAVVARSDQQGEKYLAAYITAEAELEPEELRQQLLEELPDYMVPSAWMQLEQMPLSPSGKIDRKTLPEPALGQASTLVPPRNDVDATILKVWRDILSVEMIGIDDEFFRLGGNSIKAIQVVSRLALDFEVGINDIFEHPTVRTLADHIKYSKDRLKGFVQALQQASATGQTGATILDGGIRRSLREYRMRNRNYDHINLTERSDYHDILLAGATGYLGIHILYQLLQKTDYTIHVPVRGANDAEALERLQAKLRFHFGSELGWQHGWEGRLIVFRGDLTEEAFGLSEERYERLANTVDAVMNTAANVKHFGHYEEFVAVNVEGNRRLIDFANAGKKKDYNFVSTTSVGSGWIEDQSSILYTEYDGHVGQSLDNYYVMTKLEAEQEIVEARKTGLTSNVFRVGNLVFDSHSGVFQENISDNAFYSLIKSLVTLGKVPDIQQKTMNFSFVDEVAEAVVLLFDRKHLSNETYHLYNSHQISMRDFADLLGQAEIHVEAMPMNEFTEYMLAQYNQPDTQQEIARILVHSNVFFEGASKTLFLLRNSKSDQLLRKLGFEWSRVDDHKVRLMMEHIRKVGFM